MLLHICRHLKTDAPECGNHLILNELLGALRSMYKLTVRKAKKSLRNLRKVTKLSLSDHAVKVKNGEGSVR